MKILRDVARVVPHSAPVLSFQLIKRSTTTAEISLSLREFRFIRVSLTLNQTCLIHCYSRFINSVFDRSCMLNMNVDLASSPDNICVIAMAAISEQNGITLSSI